MSYEQIKNDLKADPFILRRESFCGRWTETRNPGAMRFRNRGGKIYLEAELETWPSEHESERRRFESWLIEKLKPYGWKPRLTSGGCGNYTFRLNDDLT